MTLEITQILALSGLIPLMIIKILNNADGVIVVNWASNLKGTQLTEHVFTNSPKALHFIDPADIETRKQEFLDSITKLSDIIDILSINENECNSLASIVGIDPLIHRAIIARRV